MPGERLTGRQRLAEVEKGTGASRQERVRAVNGREEGETGQGMGTRAVGEVEVHGSAGSMSERRECGGDVVGLGRLRCENGASLSLSLLLPS